MGNKITWNSSFAASPAGTDDAQEGALRIRETRQAVQERLNNDHVFGGVTEPSLDIVTDVAGDSGYHRHLTLLEKANGYNPSTHLANINTGDKPNKSAKIWIEDNADTNDQFIKFMGSDKLIPPGGSATREVVTTEQAQTLTNKTLTAPTLTNVTFSGASSGAIDSVPVGITTPNAGKFTTLESTSHATLGALTSDSIKLGGTTHGVTEVGAVNYADGAGSMYAGITGEIKMYAGPTAPTGWWVCDGTLKDGAIAKWSDLYDLIGRTYTEVTDDSDALSNYIDPASGSGKLFYLPNFQGRVPVGAGTGENSFVEAGSVKLSTADLVTRTLGYAGAIETTTLTEAQSALPEHTHSITQTDHTHAISVPAGADDPHRFFQTALYGKAGTTEGAKANIKNDADVVDETEKTSDTTLVRTADAHTNMQPFLVINYIIKL